MYHFTFPTNLLNTRKILHVHALLTMFNTLSHLFEGLDVFHVSVLLKWKSRLFTWRTVTF